LPELQLETKLSASYDLPHGLKGGESGGWQSTLDLKPITAQRRPTSGGYQRMPQRPLRWPDPRSVDWRNPFQDCAGWSPLVERVFTELHMTSRDDLIQRILSSSVIAPLPGYN
jgi:hypothetical protein